MDKQPSDNMNNLAELLPEGLTEHAMDEIAKLVDTVISERVDNEVNDLITKVNGFLRMKVDDIKQYALQELAQDEEFVRNGHIYENMKSMMSIELDENDKTTAISDLVNVNEEAQENVSKLTSELDRLMEENEKLSPLRMFFRIRLSFLNKKRSTSRRRLRVS